MDNYIATLRLKWNHPDPKKLQLLPYRHTTIIYGAKIQYSTKPPFSPSLDDKGIYRVHSIVGALLYYARAVDNKLLAALNEIGQQQASATKDTDAELLQLLDYVATYPNGGILFRASGMVFAGHSDAAHLNVSKALSRAGAHIMISEDTPVPTSNGPVLTVAQIIKFFMSSAAKSKIAGLFICSKAMVPIRNTLIKMGWPQPKSPIQYDNSTDVGVSNNTIIQRKTKTMNM